MNKEFVKKMIKAKRIEYEAIKEIMPDKIKSMIDSFEKDAFNFLKDIAIEIVKDNMNDKSSEENKCDTVNKNAADNKSVKKINVDFN